MSAQRSQDDDSREEVPSISSPLDYALPDAPSEASPVPQIELEPSAPPRAITAVAKRRSLMEPVVRFWFIAMLALFIITAWFLVQQLVNYYGDWNLIKTGTAVTATVADVNGDSRVGAKFPPGSPTHLKFILNGQTVQIPAILTYNSDEDFITNGQTVLIHVNPNDPSNFTDRAAPEPLQRRMIAVIVIGPAVLATLAAALWLRRRALGVWRDGIAVPYVVVDRKHTALAPRSSALRCAQAEGDDKRLATVYLPSRFKVMDQQLIWLIVKDNNPASAIAAAAYES